MGVIDITMTVEAMKTTFISAALTMIEAAALAIPGVGPVAAWFIRTLGAPALSWALTKLANWTVMEAFFENTILRKGEQANTYVAAVAFKNNLPETATDAEYEKAQLAEIDAFNSFVLLTN